MIEQLKALANETRLAIVQALCREGGQPTRWVARIHSIRPSVASHHLQVLEKAGLIEGRSISRSKYWHVLDEAVWVAPDGRRLHLYAKGEKHED